MSSYSIIGLNNRTQYIKSFTSKDNGAIKCSSERKGERQNQVSEKWEEAPVVRRMDCAEELGLMLKTKFCSIMSESTAKGDGRNYRGKQVSWLQFYIRASQLQRMNVYEICIFGAGLKRCGKSCRLRWLNYLRPDIKRGNITQEEEELIIRLHKLLGNRYLLLRKPCKLR